MSNAAPARSLPLLDTSIRCESKDLLTEDGAKELVACIIKYWCARGFSGIHAWAFHTATETFGVWSVRSNIKPNGFPPRGNA